MNAQAEVFSWVAFLLLVKPTEPSLVIFLNDLTLKGSNCNLRVSLVGVTHWGGVIQWLLV